MNHGYRPQTDRGAQKWPAPQYCSAHFLLRRVTSSFGKNFLLLRGFFPALAR
jgi:hypothetical protein